MPSNSTNSDGRPLATFALYAYNQEAFIREAVEAALKQSYEPLEIILSDDASSDATFAIMQEVVSEYRGPHHVSVRRNPMNLGLAEHINAVARLCTSEYTIVAAGDDVSRPNRVERLMRIFLARPDAAALLSDYTEIDEYSRVEGPIDGGPRRYRRVSLLDMAAFGGGIGRGATFAYKTECFRWPAELPAALVSEDRLLPFRAGLIGKVYRSQERLVLYRRVSGSLGETLARSKQQSRNRPEHWAWLVETVCAAERERRINSISAQFIRGFLRARWIVLRLRESDGKPASNVRRHTATVLNAFLRLIRKLSPRPMFINP